MADVLSFYPSPASTVTVSVSASSQRVQVYPERGPIQVRVCNQGTATAWIEAGDSNIVVASATGIPIPAGDTEVFSFNNSGNGPLFIAVIAVGATGNISFTPGRGI